MTPEHQPSMVPPGDVCVPGCPCRCWVCTQACGCLQGWLSPGCIFQGYSRARDIRDSGTAFAQVPGDPYTSAGPENLDPATLWACLCHAEPLASIVSAPPILFTFYFSPSLHSCANEYFMASNQREFPRLLPGPSAPPATGTDPGVGGLGRMCLPRSHLGRRGPGQGRKQWLWRRQLCRVPLAGGAVTVPSACEGPASGPRWGLGGPRTVSLRTRTASPRRPRLPAPSDTTARVPSCPPCAISRHSCLNEPCPRLTSPRPCRCAVRGLLLASGSGNGTVARTERGSGRGTGRGTAQALRGLPWAPVHPSWRCPGTAPKPAGRQQGFGSRKWGTMLLPSLPEFVIYTLQWGAGRGASAGLALGGVGHLLPLPEPENVAGAELETEPGATLFLLPIAVALATPCPLALGTQAGSKYPFGRCRPLHSKAP